jgi:ferredoxin--NADP+ reductase
MYKILRKESLNPETTMMNIEAPYIAAKAKPGQFIMLRKNENSEHIPLTIADFDRTNGTVSVAFQNTSLSTRELETMNSGDELRDVIGPLGEASDIDMFGRVVLVANGTGIAQMYPIARALYEANSYVTVILGARSADMLYWEEKINAVCDELYICTDDGSKGDKGSVTAKLREQLEASWITSQVWAIGSLAMMKSCSSLAKSLEVPIYVNLFSQMEDKSAMHDNHRVEVSEEMLYACVEGLEFDGAGVNWDIVQAQRKMSLPKKQRAVQFWLQMQNSHSLC